MRLKLIGNYFRIPNRPSKVMIFSLAMMFLSPAFADFNSLVRCANGSFNSKREYQIYTMGERLLVRTTVQQPNVAWGSADTGGVDYYYEGVLGQSPILLKKNRVEWIELSALPQRNQQTLEITSTVKGDSRFGEQDRVSKMKCQVSFFTNSKTK